MTCYLQKKSSKCYTSVTRWSAIDSTPGSSRLEVLLMTVGAWHWCLGEATGGSGDQAKQRNTMWNWQNIHNWQWYEDLKNLNQCNTFSLPLTEKNISKKNPYDYISLHGWSLQVKLFESETLTDVMEPIPVFSPGLNFVNFVTIFRIVVLTWNRWLKAV